jgi:hypothetical protein
MHLADYNEAFVGGKIWTETRHIEQRLADLTEHMENVIQKYLRNEYATIALYNDEAGEIAEPFRFVVVCDFPTNFSDGAARRLTSILSSGARCGVYALISMDTRLDLPRGMALADLRSNCVTLEHDQGRFVWKDPDFEQLPLSVDPPPPESFVTEKLNLVGDAALDSTRVEVPFAAGPGRGHAAAVPDAGPRHEPARPDRRQNRLRQVHDAACAHHEPGLVVQPGPGRVLSRGLQEGRRRTPGPWPSRAIASSASVSCTVSTRSSSGAATSSGSWGCRTSPATTGPPMASPCPARC